MGGRLERIFSKELSQRNDTGTYGKIAGKLQLAEINIS